MLALDFAAWGQTSAFSASSSSKRGSSHACVIAEGGTFAAILARFSGAGRLIVIWGGWALPKSIKRKHICAEIATSCVCFRSVRVV